MSVSPWESINITLGTNVCWICGNPFQKGKVKKMFMISQVLDYFKMIKDLDQQITALSITTPNISNCYNEYVQYEYDVNKVIENMKKSRIEPWMSGLVCSTNEECQIIVEAILDTAPSPAISIQSNSIPRDPKACPPDCGCDNPWAFIAR